MKNEKYMVWKMSEVLKVCTQGDMQKLDTLMDRILRLREQNGEEPVSEYIVVDNNEPYAPLVRELIKMYTPKD
ncbi:hypothetical protein [Phage f2b1]|nr:hypothetical protein [Phage f2b1]